MIKKKSDINCQWIPALSFERILWVPICLEWFRHCLTLEYKDELWALPNSQPGLLLCYIKSHLKLYQIWLFPSIELAPQLKAENKEASANLSNATKRQDRFTAQASSHHCRWTFAALSNLTTWESCGLPQAQCQRQSRRWGHWKLVLFSMGEGKMSSSFLSWIISWKSQTNPLERKESLQIEPTSHASVGNLWWEAT